MTVTVILPAYLASALVNGDTSGLDERDMGCLEAALEYLGDGHVVGVGDSFFAWTCDLPGYRLGGEMAEFTVRYGLERR